MSLSASGLNPPGRSQGKEVVLGRLLNISILVSVLLPVSVFGQAKEDYKPVNQGDWAVVLVKGLGLDAGREMTGIEDYIGLLTEKGIAPESGWEDAGSLTYEDLAVTVKIALEFLGTEGSPDNLDAFRGMLQRGFGISLDLLQLDLPPEPISRRMSGQIISSLIQMEGAVPETIIQRVRRARAAPQAAAAPSIISQLAEALNLQGAGAIDYWAVFSQPVSPILP